MLTPVQYAARYWELEVPFSDGSVKVSIDKYHLGAPDPAQGKLWSKLKAHFHEHRKHNTGYALPLTVNSETHEFRSTDELLRRVVSPFYGKGSPEDCQITLQLAVLLGETTKANLQRYSDKYLGLDCNGFIGNYLWHEWGQPVPWHMDPGRHDPGPSALIDSLLKFGQIVKTVDEIKPERIHILAEVNNAYKVIPGGSAGVGHIMITEPKSFMKSFTFNSFGGLDPKLGQQGIYQSPAHWTVESTGHMGLVDSWYVFQQVNGQHNKPVPGVFRVFRGSKGQFMNVRISALDF